MDVATSVRNIVSRYTEDHKYLTKSAGSGNINTKSLDHRQVLISQVDIIVEALKDSIDQLNNLALAAKQLQYDEIRTLDIILGNVKNGKASGAFRTQPTEPSLLTGPPPGYPHVSTQVSTQASAQTQGSINAPTAVKSLTNPAWTLVQRKPKPNDIIKSERVPSPRTLPPLSGTYERIPITSSIVLNAIPVRGFADVRCDGNLYYVGSCSHFAIIINGMMFHGNIGIIYTDTEDPEKIKDCKFVDGCNRANSCRYYHDPTIFHGSSDRRNYIASSFIYTSPHAIYKNRSRSRRYGSIEYLDSDILGLNDEEKNRMYDQVMHDLLCALVLKSIEHIKK